MSNVLKAPISKIGRGIIFLILGLAFYPPITISLLEMVLTDGTRREQRLPMDPVFYKMMLCVAGLWGFLGLFMLVRGLMERHERIAARIVAENPEAAKNAAPQAVGANLPANIPSFIASLGMCAAFFMPWITVMGGIGIAGNTIGASGSEGRLVWAILILAGLSALLHLFRPVKALHVVAGLAPFALLAYFVSKSSNDLIQAMSIGAWMTLVCGIVLLAVPVKVR